MSEHVAMLTKISFDSWHACVMFCWSRHSQKTYGNGASGAADACVGLFVVSAFICIVMYKTVKVR